MAHLRPPQARARETSHARAEVHHHARYGGGQDSRRERAKWMGHCQAIARDRLLGIRDIARSPRSHR